MANYKEMPLSEATRQAALDRSIDIRAQADGTYSVYDGQVQFSREGVSASQLDAVVQEACRNSDYWNDGSPEEHRKRGR